MATYIPVLSTVRKNSPFLYAVVMLHFIGAIGALVWSFCG